MRKGKLAWVIRDARIMAGYPTLYQLNNHQLKIQVEECLAMEASAQQYSRISLGHTNSRHVKCAATYVSATYAAANRSQDQGPYGKLKIG